MWCQSCKALQITPEDKIYKAAKHKKIELKNKKVIHLLHFNERESSASAVVANGAEPNATMENYNNIATSQILIARNTFEDPPNPLTPLPTISNTFTDVRPLSAVRTEQPRPLTAHVNEAFTANESSSSSSYNKKDQASHTQGDVSIQLKPDPSSAVSRALSELNKPLESYDTFSRFLNSTKFKPSFRGGFDCLEGDTTLGYSVFFRRKIRLDTLGLESKMSHFDVNMNNLQAQMACPNLPLLFYIHGVGGSSLIWKSQLEFFNDRGYEIIAMDLIGHGASSVVNEPKMYEFLEMSSDILQIFDMFATKSNNNVVIGHSYGASFATYLAQHRKNFITKLILIAGGAPYPLEYRSAFLNSPLCCIKVFKPVLNCRFYWYCIDLFSLINLIVYIGFVYRKKKVFYRDNMPNRQHSKSIFVVTLTSIVVNLPVN
jgi:hypothetical protein